MKGFKKSICQTKFLIDLSLSFDELFENISKNTCYNVTRAEKKESQLKKLRLTNFANYQVNYKKKGLKDISTPFVRYYLQILKIQ